MGIRERKKLDGSSYFTVEIRRKGHERITKSFDDYFDAEHFTREIETELSQSIRIPPHTDEGERLQKFFEEPLLDAIKRFERSTSALDRHTHVLPTIKRHVGKVNFRQIKKSWVKSFVQKMRSTKSRRGIPYADPSIASMVQTINVIAKWRADDMDLSDQRLPLTIEGMPGKWKVERDRRLSADEERRLMARLRQIDRPNRYQWRLLIRLALETGARQQEMVKAEWREVDIDKRVWLIPAAHTKAKKDRAVPLTKKAVRIFKLLRLLSPGPWARVFEGLGASAGCVSTCFGRYSRGAGLENFHFHDLRHEACSRMALYWRGFTIFELMLIVGHTRLEMFRRYANLRGEELVAKFGDTL